jgi:hypothetical protein
MEELEKICNYFKSETVLYLKAKSEHILIVNQPKRDNELNRFSQIQQIRRQIDTFEKLRLKRFNDFYITLKQKYGIFLVILINDQELEELVNKYQ